MIQVLVDGNADTQKARAFSSSLADVKDASESLLQELDEIAQQKSTESNIVAHYEKRVNLAREKLVNRSQIAHLSGLILLSSLDISVANEQNHFSSLQYLKPQRLIGIDEANQLLAKEIDEAEYLAQERAVIVAEAKTLRDKALDTYSKINEELVI